MKRVSKPITTATTTVVPPSSPTRTKCISSSSPSIPPKYQSESQQSQRVIHRSLSSTIEERRKALQEFFRQSVSQNCSSKPAMGWQCVDPEMEAELPERSENDYEFNHDHAPDTKTEVYNNDNDENLFVHVNELRSTRKDDRQHTSTANEIDQPRQPYRDRFSVAPADHTPSTHINITDRYHQDLSLDDLRVSLHGSEVDPDSPNLEYFPENEHLSHDEMNDHDGIEEILFDDPPHPTQSFAHRNNEKQWIRSSNDQTSLQPTRHVLDTHRELNETTWETLEHVIQKVQQLTISMQRVMTRLDHDEQILSSLLNRNKKSQ